MPLVSVIIPTYNRSGLVREAINSVLSQTVKDVEVIVVDDGSTDDTKSVVAAMGERRVRYFNTPNGGPAKARNYGLDRAGGDYVAFLDSDDLWPPDYLQRMTDSLLQNTQYGAAYSSIEKSDFSGVVHTEKKPDGPSGRIACELFKTSFIWIFAAVFRRSAWADIRFDESLATVAEDSDVILRMSLRTQFLFVRQAYAIHRSSHDSISAAHNYSLNRLLSLERFYFQLGGSAAVAQNAAYKKLSHTCRSLAKKYLRNGAKTAARHLFARAITYRPFDVKLYIGLVQSMLPQKTNDPMPHWHIPSPLGIPRGNPASKIITNIVFTKNRPLQLEGYLESFYRFMPKENVATYILYKEELFGEQYEEVFRKFNHCRVIREKDFNRDFLEILSRVETDYINFGTDDVVYFDSVDLRVVEETFRKFGDDIFGFSLRMSPHSIQEKRIDPSTIHGADVFSVDWKRAADKTARYPFELNGTIYRTALVREIISHVCRDKAVLKRIFAKDSLRVRSLRKIFPMKNFLILLNAFCNPNSLEGHCYRWVKTHKRSYPGKLFFQKLCSAAIQVNIVNTVVDNPIDGLPEHTVVALNEKFTQGCRFDIDFLVKNKPRQTHCGKEVFRLKPMEQVIPSAEGVV